MSLAPLFDLQANACARLGSPFMERLLRVCGARLAPGTPVVDRLVAWPGDASATGDAIALRFCGALHALVLMEMDPELVTAYPPNDVSDDALWCAVDGAIHRHEAHMMHWLNSAPQTNEVRRSVALIAVAQLLGARFPGLSLRLSELGASARLNLHFDQFALALPDGSRRGSDNPVITLTPDWTGPLPPNGMPPNGLPPIADRRGVDLNPLNPTDPNAVLRLRSYTWPDQPDRMQRLDAALSVADPVVDQGDAADWLAQRLRAPTPGQIDLVYHTIAWQYFPKKTDAACRAALASASDRARPDAPLAHLSVESFGHGKNADVTLTLWPGDGTCEVHELGQIDPHGRGFFANDAMAG